MSVIDTLIFDRTNTDVEEVRTLRNKILASGYDSLTTEEKTKYQAGMKGAYNYTDMNRVGNAISYVVNRGITLEQALVTLISNSGLEDNALYHLGIDVSTTVTPKTNWVVGDTPSGEQCRHYIDELNIIHNMLPGVVKPSIPLNMDYLTLESANNIEKNLYLVDTNLTSENTKKEELINSSSSGLRTLGFTLSRSHIGNRSIT